MVLVCMNENELKGLAELLRELEETLLTLQATKNPEHRSLLVRKISWLFTEIERNPTAFGMLDTILNLLPDKRGGLNGSTQH
jgi:hypothetical protein